MPTEARLDATVIPADEETRTIEEPSTEELLEAEKTRVTSLESALVEMTANRDRWVARAEAAEAGMRRLQEVVQETAETLDVLRQS